MERDPTRRAGWITGIVADAAALGCDRHHLRLCIIGKRKSPKLLSRYEKLKAAQKSTSQETPQAKTH